MCDFMFLNIFREPFQVKSPIPSVIFNGVYNCNTKKAGRAVKHVPPRDAYSL